MQPAKGAFSEFHGVGNDQYNDPVRKWWMRLYAWALGADTLDAQTRDIKYVLGAFDEMQSVGVTKDNWWVLYISPFKLPKQHACGFC